MAANYENSAQPVNGVSYHSTEPQVPDTTFGPMVHTYKPRFDHIGLGTFPMVPGLAAQSGFTHFGTWQTREDQKLTMTQGNPMAMQAPISLPPTGAPLFMQPAVHPPMLLSAANGMSFSQPAMAMGAGVACMPATPGALLPAASPGMFVQGNGGVHPEPACGIGRTGAEYTAEQMDMAYANKSFEPQDFKPADDTPSRMYMCRELDGVWTMRSRFSIDRMAKEWRWHMAPEGYFYAVRLPN
ncbi:hypothetical protein PpBr36_00559 [Pyricularia pennisetigena]|uniref:hypothetical protein n=1 Tax=Pyricularia pennisetigena TaxID=1578925 RepID=UPI001152BB86|nr:hypothetical protein PpBr36_00559 [Pyricularia pennisetigena]TLS27754.1 hypothetical protein PpBr36_00559 [Pyricularia pennisetigena]